MVSKESYQNRFKWQKAATLDKEKLTLMKSAVLELKELLAQASGYLCANRGSV